MDDVVDGGNTPPADLPTFSRKPPPMKLNRQGTFKQGSNGSVDLVDISQSPRSSRSSSRTLDRVALEQIQRIKLTDALTPEQSSDEDDHEHDVDVPLSPRSSNGSNASTPRGGALQLSQAKPALILQRQGTFVQRRDGQASQVELSPGAEIKRRLSADSTKILHETINDDDYADDDYEAPEDTTAKSASASDVDSLPLPADTTAQSASASDVDLLPLAVAPEAPTQQPDDDADPSDHEDDDHEDTYEDDEFATAPLPVVQTARKFGHNRKGTFLQNSNGKAIALDMSSRTAAPIISSDEILSREMSACTTAIEEDADDDGDRPLATIPRSPAKRPMMERKGTFIQSKSGTTAAIQLGPASTTAATARRLSDHGLQAIVDESVTSESSTDEHSVSPEAPERVRMGSLNSIEPAAQVTEQLTASSNSADLSSESGATSVAEPLTPSDGLSLPLTLAVSEPILQRKTTYIQTASGHTTTLRMAPETVAEPIISAGIEFIDEADHDSDDDHEVVAPLVPAASRVDPVKRQAYLKNRKGTFAANENGKMVQVTLAGGAVDLDSQQISLGALAQIVDEDQEAEDDEPEDEEPEDEEPEDEDEAAPVDAGLDRTVALEEAPAPSSMRVPVDAPTSIGDPVTIDERHPIVVDDDDDDDEVTLTESLVSDVAPVEERPIEDAAATSDDANPEPDRNRRPSIGKRVQISTDVVVIGSATARPASAKSSSRHPPVDVNIKRMLETAERDRQKRSRQLRRLEKSRARSRSLHYHAPPLSTTSVRTVQQPQQIAAGDELREKILRPTSAEKFVQTYRVYSPAPEKKGAGASPKGKGQRRASSSS